MQFMCMINWKRLHVLYLIFFVFLHFSVVFMSVSVINEEICKECLQKKMDGNLWYPLLCVFQECESSLKQKTELIGRLEAKAAEMAETIRNLESQYVFQGPQSSNEPSQAGQRSRSKSYIQPPTNSMGEEQADGEGQKGVGKSASMSELQNRAAGKL